MSFPHRSHEDFFDDGDRPPLTKLSTIESQRHQRQAAPLLSPRSSAQTSLVSSLFSLIETIILYYQKLLPSPNCTFMGPRRQRRFIFLRDGRKLSYILDGPSHLMDDPSAAVESVPVIIAFHAMFLSSTSFVQHPPPCDYIVVSMDGPGYHGSSPVVIGEYSYNDFVKDVEELADHLGIKEFSVVGHSSGGPNALACASFLKKRVVSMGIMAGDPEYATEELQYHTALPFGHEQSAHASATTGAKPHGFQVMDWFLGWCLPNFMRFVPFVNVTNGLQNDFYLERQKWPFVMEEVTQPAVVVLGDQDCILPNDVAVRVHNRLQYSQLKMLKGVGHNDLLKDDILDMIFHTVIDLAKPSNNNQEML